MSTPRLLPCVRFDIVSMPPPATPKKLPDKAAKKSPYQSCLYNCCHLHSRTHCFAHCLLFASPTVADTAASGAEESLSVEDEKVFLQRQLDALKLQLGQWALKPIVYRRTHNQANKTSVPFSH